MITSRRQFAGLSMLLTIGVIIATGWLNWTDRVEAQQGAKQAPPPLDLSGSDLDSGGNHKKLSEAFNAAQAEKWRINPKDIPVMRFLASTFTVEWKKPLDVILLEILPGKSRDAIAIIIDKGVLQQAERLDTLKEAIEYEGTKVTVRMALRTILGQKELGYYIDDGALRITTKMDAQREVVTKYYPARPIFSPENLPAQVTQRSFLDNLRILKDSIEETVEPRHWEFYGGPGSIRYFSTTDSFKIRCSVEVHYLLAASGMLKHAPGVVEKDLPLMVDVTKVYSLAGLIAAKNREQSRADLERALKLVIPERIQLPAAPDPPAQIAMSSMPVQLPVSPAVELENRLRSGKVSTFAILLDKELLVVRQLAAVQTQVESLLRDSARRPG